MAQDLEAKSLAKLDAIARLLAASVTRGMKTGECILLLSRAGLDRSTIADICGTTPDAVSARVSEARRRQKAPSPQVPSPPATSAEEIERNQDG